MDGWMDGWMLVSGADPRFFLGRGAPLRKDVSDRYAAR